MAKAFELDVPFTPRWRGNRERAADEQFTVRIRDLDTPAKNAILKDLRQNVPDVWDMFSDEERRKKSDIFRDLDANIAYVDWSIATGKRYVVSVENLEISAREGEEKRVVKIKTAEDLEKHAPDVLMEVSSRILMGPDEEELKNSSSPSSV